MQNYETLWKHDWVEIRKVDDWYVYSHIPTGNGEGVAVLIYDFSDDENMQLLGRYERRPCHTVGHSKKHPDLMLTSITGLDDKPHLSKAGIAVEEVLEEAGIVCTEDELIPLGLIYPSKASDNLVTLFALDGSKKTLGPTNNQGKLEQDGFVEWMPMRDFINQSNCPLVGHMAMKLLFKITSD